MALVVFPEKKIHKKMHTPSCVGDTTPEGTKMEKRFTKLGLSQLITEPTNIEPHKNPSCIDLVVTDQPNIILDSGTRASLDSYCHHQIVHCKINFRIPPPLPFDRKIWHFNRANSAAIKRSMTNFPWPQQLNMNTDHNWKVKIFVPRDPPWISNTPNSSIVKSPIKFMFLCACVNYINKLIPIKSAIEIPLKIAIFNAIF